MSQEELNLAAQIRAQLKKAPTQLKVFELLSDRQWHCREHEGKQVASAQYAGGGGIQGLQRGNRERPGLAIESEDRYCEVCQKKTRHDRWNGKTQATNSPANIPIELQRRILEVNSYTDIIELRERQAHELVIDHRFPMIRWGDSEPPHDPSMSEDEIKKKFQLLKKDRGGNHNLLKSRSCERCIATGKRGTPLGIIFWYKGGENWPEVPEKGKDAEEGCVGCGWYDFETWRNVLNQKIAQSELRS